MERATGRAVIVMDADLQDPPEVVLDMVAKWKPGRPRSTQSERLTREGETRFKRFTADLFYRLIGRLQRGRIPRNVGDFRLVDRKPLDAFLAMPERDRFVRGMFAWVGFRQAVVNFHRPPRATSKTKYSLTKMLRLAISGVVSFSDAPLRLALWAGLAISSLAILYGLWVIAMWTMNADFARGWRSIAVLVTFLGGANMLMTGVLGVYVGRIYSEVKRHPLYVVEREAGFAAPAGHGGQPRRSGGAARLTAMSAAPPAALPRARSRARRPAACRRRWPRSSSSASPDPAAIALGLLGDVSWLITVDENGCGRRALPRHPGNQPAGVTSALLAGGRLRESLHVAPDSWSPHSASCRSPPASPRRGVLWPRRLLDRLGALGPRSRSSPSPAARPVVRRARHLAAVYGLPFLAVSAARAARAPVDARLALLAGLGAGLMAAIKPPYALVAIVLLPYLVRRAGVAALLKAVEYCVAAAFGLAYVAAVPRAFPDYVANILPIGLDLYAPIREPLRPCPPRRDRFSPLSSSSAP